MRHTEGKRWRHIIFNTHNTWLHGDPRGFRDHDHRVHSSGDYRNPPPRTEHVGLRDYFADRAGEPVRLPRSCMKPIGEAIVANLHHQSHDLVVLAVTPTHVHFLVELPDNVMLIKKIVGWCKYFATKAARKVDPAPKDVNLWAEGEAYKPVDEDSHYYAANQYIRTMQGADAWVWDNKPVTNA